MKKMVFGAIFFLMALFSIALVSASGLSEIRGPVEEVHDGHQYILSASGFPGTNIFTGFYYDIDDDIGTESLILNIKGNTLEGDAGSPGIVYDSFAKSKPFKFKAWGDYNVIGFLAEKYFAGYVNAEGDNDILYENSADVDVLADEQLLEVLMDEDKEQTISSSDPLRLKNGYALTVRSVDTIGNKVYLDLTKGEEVVDSKVISPSGEDTAIGDATYYYKVDVGNTTGLAIIAAHVKNAFHGVDRDLATIDGIFQLSDEARSVKQNTKYDAMRVSKVDPFLMRIKMDNKDEAIRLIESKDTVLMKGIRIRVAERQGTKENEPLRFYVYKELVKPDTYVIRGRVDETVIGAEYSYSFNDFPGFYYDLDNNLGTETMKIKIDGDTQDWNTNKLDVTYRTDGKRVPFKFDEWGEYYAICYLGEKYFAGYVQNPSDSERSSPMWYSSEDKNLMDHNFLTRVLIDSDDELQPLTAGSEISLEEGYRIKMLEVDVGGDKILFRLLKNSSDVNEIKVMDLDDESNYYHKEVLSTGDNITTIALHFQNAFNSSNVKTITIKGIWQISDQPEEIMNGHKLDNMTITEVHSAEGEQSIVLRNKDHQLRLASPKSIHLMKDFYIRTADQAISASNPLRFFVSRKMTVGVSADNKYNPTITAEDKPSENISTSLTGGIEVPTENRSHSTEKDNASAIPGLTAFVAISILLAAFRLKKRRD